MVRTADDGQKDLSQIDGRDLDGHGSKSVGARDDIIDATGSQDGERATARRYPQDARVLERHGRRRRPEARHDGTITLTQIVERQFGLQTAAVEDRTRSAIRSTSAI